MKGAMPPAELPRRITRLGSLRRYPWRPNPDRHIGPCKGVTENVSYSWRAPCKGMTPRRRDRPSCHPNRTTSERGPGLPSQPSRPGCSSAQFRVARAVKGPRRRYGAVCSLWFPISARCTCKPPRPRRMAGSTPTTSMCAWIAKKNPRKGRGARAHVAPWHCWQLWPWVTPFPDTGALTTGRTPSCGPGPHTPAGDKHPHTAKGPYCGTSTCARDLTCLLQALEQDQIWETLTRLLNFPRIFLAAPALVGKATKPSSTQQCRLNCLTAVMDPLGELTARIHQQAMTDGPQKRTQSMAAASGTSAASPQASERTAEAVRDRLAEGAPGRALQLLTSDGSVIRPTRTR